MIKTGNKQINTADYWDDRYKDREAYMKETGMMRFLKALEEIDDHDRVLDIGCGIGQFTELVKATKKDTTVWGTDISPLAIEDNKKRNKDITYYVSTVGEQQLLPDNYFDVVFSGEVLEHIDNPHDLFKDAYKCLKRGGTFIVTTPLNDQIITPEHMHYFTREDVTLLYDVNGFDNIRHIFLPQGYDQLIIMAIGKKI